MERSIGADRGRKGKKEGGREGGRGGRRLVDYLMKAARVEELTNTKEGDKNLLLFHIFSFFDIFLTFYGSSLIQRAHWLCLHCLMQYLGDFSFLRPPPPASSSSSSSFGLLRTVACACRSVSSGGAAAEDSEAK